MKLTPWFPHHIKPVHIGVYEVHSCADKPDHRYFSAWDGSEWAWTANTAADAAKRPSPSLYQLWPWRGLAKEPK
jgi:hypothetical protein